MTCAREDIRVTFRPALVSVIELRMPTLNCLVAAWRSKGHAYSLMISSSCITLQASRFQFIFRLAAACAIFTRSRNFFLYVNPGY